MNANIVTLVGRLAMDPVLKQYNRADGTPGLRFFCRLAVGRRSDLGEKDSSKRRTNFIPIVAWGKAAQQHATFLRKGTEVTIIGELIDESQQQEDGTWKEFHYVQIDQCQYGQRSLKNATTEDLQRRGAVIAEQLQHRTAGGPQVGIPVPGMPTNLPPMGAAPANVPPAPAPPATPPVAGSPFEAAAQG